MTDKERLEEIKKLRETILEENDFRTRCVLASVFVGLGYMDYLINRVQELEEEVERYREALSIISANLPLDEREHYVYIARQALEGEE